MLKTLLFCTSFADVPSRWEMRYRKWLDFVAKGAIRNDQVLMIDDGSATLPSWRDLLVLRDLPGQPPKANRILFHFPDNLGRAALLVYPGWFRSFAFAAKYARHYGFEKVVHVESDCFVYSERLAHFINALSTGWTTFWCPSQGFPETCIQVIGTDQMGSYLALSERNYEKELSHRAIETLLPFTDVRRDFLGDRYGEFAQWVPEGADYGCQIPEEWPS